MSKKNSLHQPGSHIEEVPGVTVPWKWAGRNQAGNRRSIPPNYFWTVDNVRLEDDDVIGRKGLTKVNSSDNSGSNCTIGIHTQPSFPTGGRFIATILDINNAETDDLYGYSIALDETTAKDLVPGSNAINSEWLIKYNGNIYDDYGRLLTFREEAGTLVATVGEQVIFPEPRVSFPGSGAPAEIVGAGSQAAVGPTLDTTRPGQMDLYFVSESGEEGSGVPYRWDGNQSYQLATASDMAGISPQHVGFHNEKLVVIDSHMPEGATGMYVREFDGTWTAVTTPTLPGGVTDVFVVTGVTNYKDKLLLSGCVESGSNYGGAILVFDGTSLTVGTSGLNNGNAEAEFTGIYDVTVFANTYLYPYWNSSTGVPYIGTYNGTTFNDTAVNVSTKIATGYGIVGIAGAGKNLFVTAVDYDGLAGNVKMYTARGFNGTYTELTVENTAFRFGIQKAFVL